VSGTVWRYYDLSLVDVTLVRARDGATLFHDSRELFDERDVSARVGSLAQAAAKALEPPPVRPRAEAPARERLEPSTVEQRERPDEVPWPLLTALLGSGFPWTIAAELVCTAIPHVDLEAVFLANPGGGGLGVGAGPRAVFLEEREEGVGRVLQGGLLLRVVPIGSIGGSGVLLAALVHLDHTWWFARHFGLTLRASAGALTDVQLRGALPQVDLSVGLSF
jgi:hypothetical protein